MSKAPDYDSVYRLMNEIAKQQRKALHAMTLKPSFQATSKLLEEFQKAQRQASELVRGHALLQQ
jgi:hypothetical protein